MTTAKNNKKTAINIPPKITKTYFDNYTKAVHKTLRLLGLDPRLFDQLSKRQKLELMKTRFDIPRIEIKAGHLVPRQYLKFAQKTIYDAIEESFVGDEQLQLSTREYLTMGVSFFVILDKMKNDFLFANVKHIPETLEAFYHFESTNGELTRLIANMKTILCYLSKFNFRVYGFEWQCWVYHNNSLKYIFQLTSYPAMAKKIAYQGVFRSAFQVGYAVANVPGVSVQQVKFNELISTSTDTRLLNVYVQSHALNRLKERCDNIYAGFKNNFLTNSMHKVSVIRTNNQQYYVKYFGPKGMLLGYLPFTIINSDVFVLSFLPLCHHSTPEGQKLCELLQISKDDISFLGMDKLSFYSSINFEAIPKLKNALIESNMWHLTLPYEGDFFDDEAKAGVSTEFVSRYFENS